jgi:hypothetical protein
MVFYKYICLVFPHGSRTFKGCSCDQFELCLVLAIDHKTKLFLAVVSHPVIKTFTPSSNSTADLPANQLFLAGHSQFVVFYGREMGSKQSTCVQNITVYSHGGKSYMPKVSYEKERYFLVMVWCLHR